MRFLRYFIFQNYKTGRYHCDVYSYIYRRTSISERTLFSILKSINFKILFRPSFRGFFWNMRVFVQIQINKNFYLLKQFRIKVFIFQSVCYVSKLTGFCVIGIMVVYRRISIQLSSVYLLK